MAKYETEFQLGYIEGLKFALDKLRDACWADTDVYMDICDERYKDIE